MCGSFLKPFPCLLNAFFVFSVSLRDLQIAATPEAVCRYLGRWSWAKNRTNLNQLWILTHTLCIRWVGNKQLQRLQQLFRKSWITDLASETEMSRDWTNMEHRYEVEGSTWAGVCRSWKKQQQQWSLKTPSSVVMYSTKGTGSLEGQPTNLFHGGRGLRQRRSLRPQAAVGVLMLLSVFPQQQIERRHGYAVVNHKLERGKQETCY